MRKYITIVLALLVLGGAYGISKKLSSRKKPSMKHRAISLPLAYVKSVKNIDMSVEIPASGSLVAKDKFKLYSEVQGVLENSKKEFKPGVVFKKGEILYKLNSDEFYTNLLAQKSSFQNLVVSMMPDLRLDYKDSYEQWQKYVDAFDIHQSLPELPDPKSSKEKRFIASKNVYTNYYSIKNLEIKLDKYTIRAPFDGVLTEANITLGTLVSPGMLLGEFVNPKVYEMEVSLNSEYASMLKVGEKVEVRDLENNTKVYTGKILRINEKVDLTSQTVNVFVELRGKGLREGMYLKANLQSKVLNSIVEVPRNLLIQQSKLYVIADSTLHLTDITLVHQNEQSIVVRGLKDMDQLLIKPVPKAFEGMQVVPVMAEGISSSTQQL